MVIDKIKINEGKQLRKAMNKKKLRNRRKMLRICSKVRNRKKILRICSKNRTHIKFTSINQVTKR